MDKVLIYISYDQYEYTNYFHLAVNDDVMIEYCPEEKVDDLFKAIYEKECTVRNFELYVVKNKDASEWDYRKTFQEYGIEIHPISNKNPEQLCQVTAVFLDDGIIGKDDISDKELISTLYSGNCVSQKDNFESEETLKQAEEILKRGGEEMTELARIIKEKYERMDRHDKF